MGEKLSEIAAGMLERLAATGETQPYTLPRGLNLALSQVGGRRMLRLKREGVLPSDLEVKICRAAFGVSACAEEREVAAAAPWRAVALTWEVICGD